MNSNIQGIKIGHWTDLDNKTGCTAIISDMPLVASIDVRGGAPGTKEIALLDPIAREEEASDGTERQGSEGVEIGRRDASAATIRLELLI